MTSAIERTPDSVVNIFCNQFRIHRGTQFREDRVIADCVLRRFVDGIVGKVCRDVIVIERIVRNVLIGLGGIVQVVRGQSSRTRIEDQIELVPAVGPRRDRDVTSRRVDDVVCAEDKCLDLVVDFVERERQADRNRHTGSRAEAGGERRRGSDRIDP
jgi:hypothetical protein